MREVYEPPTMPSQVLLLSFLLSFPVMAHSFVLTASAIRLCAEPVPARGGLLEVGR